MQFFLHPVYMIAGGVLVASPILIHLINRMRFKRVRWAAMEFLLKSQKRNRRRLIIEQLILLLLRILLVLLIAFLVARFVGGVFASTQQGIMHVMIIDDTLSMGDRHVDSNDNGYTAMDTAREQVDKLLENVIRANAEQHLRVYLLSDLTKPLYDDAISNQTRPTLKQRLGNVQASYLHVPPLEGVQRAHDELKGAVQGQKVLHFVSDFRHDDWAVGKGVQQLQEELGKALDAGVNVSLIDVAHPYRRAMGGAAQQHGNLAITSLEAESTRVAAQRDVLFKVKVKNFSTQEVKFERQPDGTTPSVVIKKGRSELRHTIALSKLAPGEEQVHEFLLSFAKETSAPVEYFHVSAEIPGDAVGLSADIVRDMIIEVREHIPILVIDGAGENGMKPGGDSFHLVKVLEGSGVYRADFKTVADLATLKLTEYQTVYLLNLPEITTQVRYLLTAEKLANLSRAGVSEDVLNKLQPMVDRVFENKADFEVEVDKRLPSLPEGAAKATILTEAEDDAALINLRNYVKAGGSVAFFLGKDIRPSFYNDILHTKMSGFFPVKINNRATDPMSEEEKKARRLDDPQPKILFRDENHAMFKRGDLPNFPAFLRFLIIDQYFQLQPRATWHVDAQNERNVQSILVLPTRKSMEEFKSQGRDLVAAIEKQFDEAGKVNAKFRADYTRAVQNIRRDIYAALSEKYVATLIRTLDNTLNDKGVKDNPDRPNMLEFWANPQMSLIRSQVVNYKELVEFGDPLLVERRFGLGKTVAFMTQLGTGSQWSEWAGRSLATSSFLPFVRDLQNYLSTQVLTYNQVVTNKNAGLKFDFPVTEYGPQLKVRFTPQPNLRPTEEQNAPAAPPTRDLASVTMTKTEGDDPVYQYVHDDVRLPGVYHFETTRRDKDGVEQPEVVSYAYNVDVASESDLKRAGTQALTPQRTAGDDSRKGKLVFASPGDSYEEFKRRDPDASENPWLYLLFLVILIVEQALAVHLSFHLKGSESSAPQATPATSAGAAAAA